MTVTDVNIGSAIVVDPRRAADRHASIATPGTITVTQGDGKPLRFRGGGQVLAIRVHGGLSGETFLVMDKPRPARPRSGQSIVAAVAGGRARVQ